MSSYYLDLIGEKAIAEKKENAEMRINNELRRCQVMRLVAENFDGAYVTKRITDKIIAIVPGAKNVYLTDWSETIELVILYSDYRRSGDEISFVICSKSNRRIDAKKLTETALQYELDACRKESALKRLDMAVKEYNEIARRYASVYTDLNEFFSDLPGADFSLRSDCKSPVSPDKFLDSLTD